MNKSVDELTKEERKNKGRKEYLRSKFISSENRAGNKIVVKIK